MKQFNITDLFLTSWAELNADQAAAALLHKVQLDRHVQNSRIKDAGMSRYAIARVLAKKPNILKVFSAEQMLDITNDFKFLEQPFYSFHVTWIDAGEIKLLAPEEYLSSFTFYQFIKADSEYSKYAVLNSKDNPEQNHALDRLISILYQPVRGVFDEQDIEKFIKQLPRRLTLDPKFLILRTYLNCRSYIVEHRCPNLFTREDEGSSGPVYLGPMWQDLLYDLSDTPAFMGLLKAKNARLYEALDYLEKKSKEKTTVQ